MECERLKKLVRTWYVQVQDEALAPARMVNFMKQHIAECRECLMDPSVRQEVEKITEIVLPLSKVRAPAVNPKEDEVIPVPAAAEPEPEDEEDQGEDEEELDEEDEDTDADEDEDDI